MKHIYNTFGTCSRQIEFELDGNVIKNVKFYGGCDGNTKGICAIVEGMDVDTVINKFKNIKCGHRMTSCPAQLATALLSAKNIS